MWLPYHGNKFRTHQALAQLLLLRYPRDLVRLVAVRRCNEISMGISSQAESWYSGTNRSRQLSQERPRLQRCSYQCHPELEMLNAYSVPSVLLN